MRLTEWLKSFEHYNLSEQAILELEDVVLEERKQAKQEGFELGKKEAFKQVINDGVWLPYNEWKKRTPNLAKWLEDNGFRYFEKYDKTLRR